MRRGVGLVEVVIATLVLASALVVVFQALGVGVRGTEQVGEELTGAQACSDLLDLVASVPANRLTATPGALPPDALAGPLGVPLERVLLPQGFAASVEIANLPDTTDGIAAGRLRRVKVTVTWPQGANARGHAVTMARLVTDEVGLER